MKKLLTFITATSLVFVIFSSNTTTTLAGSQPTTSTQGIAVHPPM